MSAKLVPRDVRLSSNIRFQDQDRIKIEALTLLNRFILSEKYSTEFEERQYFGNFRSE